MHHLIICLSIIMITAIHNKSYWHNFTIFELLFSYIFIHLYISIYTVKIEVVSTSTFRIFLITNIMFDMMCPKFSILICFYSVWVSSNFLTSPLTFIMKNISVFNSKKLRSIFTKYTDYLTQYVFYVYQLYSRKS